MKIRRLLTKFLGNSKNSRKRLSFQNNYQRAELSIEIANPEFFPFEEGTQFYVAPVKIDQNLCRLRHGIGRLDDAISYLEQALQVGPDSVAGRALIEASYIKYATCFTDGKSSPNLNHKQLFKNEGELAAHTRAIDLRDKYLVHSSESAVGWQTVIAVGSDGNIFDTPTILLKKNTPFQKNEVLSLHLLMVRAREILMEEVSKKMEWAMSQVKQDGLDTLEGPFTKEDLFEKLADKI